MCVATRSRNQRSWLMTTAQPPKLNSASSSARSVSTSRSFVGSSSSSRLPPRRSSFARWTRLRSPPDNSLTLRCWSGPLKLNRATYPRDATFRLLLADDHAKEGGLAGAVGADDPDDAAARQVEVQILHQQIVAVALAH